MTVLSSIPGIGMSVHPRAGPFRTDNSVCTGGEEGGEPVPRSVVQVADTDALADESEENLIAEGPRDVVCGRSDGTRLRSGQYIE